MRLEETEKSEVISSGVQWSGGYTLDAEDIPMLFRILRSSLYSDKIQAVLREYMSNAWDEHRETGQADKPIKVVLPTVLNPTLIIRDYGRGLSHEQIDKVYRRYMKSLKRGTNNPIGAFGIGAKVAFAYSDTFSITSHHMGKKCVYIGVVVDGNAGDIQLHMEGPTDESGIEIKVPVDPKDVCTFEKAARRLFPFFEPEPECNLDLNVTHLRDVRVELGVEPGEDFVCRPGTIPLDTSRTLVWAKMGPVVYPVDMAQLVDHLKHTIPRDRLFLLDLPIGSVAPHPSREALEYTNKTRETIVARLDAYVEATLAEKRKAWSDLLAWPARLYAQEVFDATGFEIGARKKVKLEAQEIKDIHAHLGTALQVALAEWGKKDTLLHVHTATKILATARTCVYVHNTKRIFRGYVKAGNVSGTVLYVKLAGTPADLRPKVDAAFKGTPLEGITVKFTEDMHYTYLSRSSGAGARQIPQHRARYFTYGGSKLTPASKSWDIFDAPPGDGDVYVILDRFEAQGFYRFHETYRIDSDIADFFGFEMPVVVGVKDTMKKPANEAAYAKAGAILYKDWSKRFRAWMRHHPKVKELVPLYNLPNSWDYRMYTRKEFAWITTDHPVLAFCDRLAQAQEALNNLNPKPTWGLAQFVKQQPSDHLNDWRSWHRQLVLSFPEIKRAPSMNAKTHCAFVDFMFQQKSYDNHITFATCPTETI